MHMKNENVFKFWVLNFIPRVKKFLLENIHRFTQFKSTIKRKEFEPNLKKRTNFDRNKKCNIQSRQKIYYLTHN